MSEQNDYSKGVLNDIKINLMDKLAHSSPQGLRLLSMLVDHFVMIFIIVPPLIMIGLIFGFDSPPIAFYAALLVYFNKDFPRGKSIAKRIFGLQVVDRKTGSPANSLQCFLRNMTIPIWPLEVIITLFSPNRRLGDLIANTKVIPAEKDPAISIIADLKKVQFDRMTLLTLLAGVVYIFLLSIIMNWLLWPL